MRSIVETIDPAGWQFQDSEGNWADTTMPKWYRDQGYEVRPLYTSDIILEAERRAEQRVRAELSAQIEQLEETIKALQDDLSEALSQIAELTS